MSYDLHITKADHWLNSENNPITKDDLDKVADLLDANNEIPFLFQRGRLTLCRANEKVIGLMYEIAIRINAQVQGDDGEFYNKIDKSFSNPHDISQQIRSTIEINESDFKIPDHQRKFIEALEIGSEIVHPKFGLGRIIEIKGEDLDTEFTITFMERIQTKRILAYFSPIRPSNS